MFFICFCSKYITHVALPENLLEEIDITETTARMNVGLENIKDIIGDLDQALKTAYDYDSDLNQWFSHTRMLNIYLQKKIMNK